MTEQEVAARVYQAIQEAMSARCEEQGHVWKRVIYGRGDLECKWCGFRL